MLAITFFKFFFPIHYKNSSDTARTIPIMNSTVCLFTYWLYRRTV